MVAHPAILEPNATRSLTFEERFAAERAIQEVYWNHRIWPSQNPGPKPSLDQVMPASAVRARVDTYLRKSIALEKIWERPITAEQLQAEIDRMTRATRQPKVLLELFHALDNDPVRIAECLARPSLVQRLMLTWYARDTRFHDAVRRKAEAALAQDQSVEGMARLGGDYRVTRWERAPEDGDDESAGAPTPGVVRLDVARWNALLERMRSRVRGGQFRRQTPLGTETDLGARPDLGAQSGIPVNALGPLDENDDSFSVAAVLEQGQDHMTTGEVLWRKTPFDEWWREQSRSFTTTDFVMPEARYVFSLPNLDVCTYDTWAPTNADQGPGEREGHTAVWTGSEMLIWGGYLGPESTAYNNEPGSVSRYNPSTDTWTLSSALGFPQGRTGHTAVWTGTRMIVWGGVLGSPSQEVKTGGVYDPATDAWTATSTGANVPAARQHATAVWSGSVMVVWGGTKGTPFADGGRYNPSTDTWLPVSTSGSPIARSQHTAVWTGNEMIVWGGTNGSRFGNGGRYNPSTDTWLRLSTTGAPSARSGHTAVWTGSEMIVWGGEGTTYNCSCSNDASVGCTTNTQCRFCNNDHSLPCTSASQCTSVGGACGTAGTCLGTGCTGTLTRLSNGGRYNPISDAWTPTGSSGALPSARMGHRAIWTGSEMIVWGGTDGSSPLGTGGRYNPSSGVWTATSAIGAAPSGRTEHTAVWTGSEMIVWGGVSSAQEETGGRYSPASDSWVATRRGVVARVYHTTVWTGSEMIVSGGEDSAGAVVSETSQRYDPTTDSWAWTTRSATSPRPRIYHGAVWTGTEMIVASGDGSFGTTATGDRYDPTNDIWTPTSTSNAPPGRLFPTAVWSGTQMILWGGYFSDSTRTNTGGRYAPSTDSWTPTSTGDNVPVPRRDHIAVWANGEMIVWGGDNGSILNTGGRYNPSTDSWTPTSTGPNVPAARIRHAGVWTGTQMIVWGGSVPAITNTGGRYDPSADTWAPTSTGSGVPPGAARPTAVWTGSEMIVWGGLVNTGGRYDPAGDFWKPTSTGPNVPSARWWHSAVATGTQMIVWGGGYPIGAVTGPDFNTGGLYCYACSAAPPSAVPGLLVAEPSSGTARLAWDTVPGASAYDIVRGSLSSLQSSGGNFAVSTQMCLENDLAATTRDDADYPGFPGEGFWYLVRAENCGPGSYDSGAPSQVGSRDPGIQVSGYACP